MAADSGIHTRAKGLTEPADRVDYCAELMSELQWERGKTGKVLAKIWGCAVNTVEHYAAEASRRVTADEGEARRDISVGCRKLFLTAVQKGNPQGARAIGELWATVSGAKAPDRHELVTATADPTKAATLVRQAFGERALPKENDAPGDTKPGGDEPVPGSAPGA